jgi:hypothetical protein
MMGVLFLFLCFTVGWGICSYAFPDLVKAAQNSYDNKPIFISPYLLILPTWYITGTLLLTWSTYIAAMLFAKTNTPLLAANCIVMPAAFVFSVVIFLIKFMKLKQQSQGQALLSVIRQRAGVLLCSERRTRRQEVRLLLAIATLASVLMWVTFFVKDNQLYVGVSVFSDFSPHIGMIRSFSYGNNFPTSYSHFAGEDIKYHFMFQFLAGNLEFLGMRIDYAFNIPSILSFICAFLMLYILAVKITAKVMAGVLCCVFFAFRSAKTLFTYLANLPAGTSILQKLSENTQFISDTPNENWGLWNLNVYCNQRHLAFGLAAIFLIIILFLPRIYEMFEALRNSISSNRVNVGIEKDNPINSDKGAFKKSIRVLFFTGDGWTVENLRLSIAGGVLLGSLAFFHGAAVIGCLLVLFAVAMLSKRRLEFLILAVITIVMSVIQSHFFIDGSAVSPGLQFGFIAENKTFFGASSYLERLLGILPLVLLAAFCFVIWEERYIMIAFAFPLFFAFTVSLTIDVTVNHKYIMMSSILLGIFAAEIVTKILERRDVVFRITGIVLVIMLTSTGIYDFITIMKKNTPESDVVLDLEDPLTMWINENSDSKDIFLTASYALNQVVLGGAMLYEGWPYYAWSAGYDTGYRDTQVNLMYESQTPQELDALVKANNIRFIIIDQDNRSSTNYTVNEENIKASYECVYSQGEGEKMTSVYDIRRPLFK